MKNQMKLKLAEIFDTYPHESSSYKAIFKDLDKRGKLDNRHMAAVIVMLVEEIDELKGKLAELSPSTKL